MLRKTLEARGYCVDEAADAYEARRRLASQRYLVVLTDLKLPAGSGFDVLHAALEADPETAVVVMTAFGTVEEAVRAMKDGASDFLTKPVDTDHLLLLLDRAVERRRLLTELVLLKDDQQQRFGLPRVLGEDPAFKDAMRALQRAAPGGHDRPAARGERHRQGAARSRPAPALAAGEGAVRRDQLRGDPREPPRERAVRPREGCLHRRDGAQGRQGGAGPQGHALPRRDRRHASAAAGQDPAARPGEAVRAGGRPRDAQRWTSASSPPPTATCARSSTRSSSARTCSSGSR